MHDMNQTSTRTPAIRRWTRLGSIVLGLSAWIGTVTVAQAGPQADADRRSREDAAIEAASDVVERSKVRNDAAAAALRLDLPPRLRTRLWWTRVAPAEAAAGRDAADRADRLASRSFAELLTVSDPAKPRLQAGATAIGATARALRDGLAADGESHHVAPLAAVHPDRQLAGGHLLEGEAAEVPQHSGGRAVRALGRGPVRTRGSSRAGERAGERAGVGQVHRPP